MESGKNGETSGSVEISGSVELRECNKVIAGKSGMKVGWSTRAASLWAKASSFSSISFPAS